MLLRLRTEMLRGQRLDVRLLQYTCLCIVHILWDGHMKVILVESPSSIFNVHVWRRHAV